MRILAVGNMYPPHHLGGAELTWRGATLHQRREGHLVRVLTTDFRVDAAPDVEEDPDVHRQLRWYWREHAFPRLGPIERLWIELHNQRVLDRHLRQFRPDVVVWWSMGGMSLSMIEAVRAAGLPAVGVVQDDFFAYADRVDGWQRVLRRLGALAPLTAVSGIPARLDLQSAARWVFNSEAMRQSAERAGLDVTGSQVAHPGVRSTEGELQPPGPWRWRLLYLGRIDPRKGIITAIRALSHLPAAQLEVVGEGDRRELERLQRVAVEVGVRERVSFGRATREAVPRLLVEADALLFPVLWEEPWGLVPLEAMAAGTPVVASGRGGGGEYLRGAENCLLFEPADDPLALAEGVRQLADDPDLRDRLRSGGLRTAARYPAEAFNEAILRAIEEVAG